MTTGFRPGQPPAQSFEDGLLARRSGGHTTGRWRGRRSGVLAVIVVLIAALGVVVANMESRSQAPGWNEIFSESFDTPVGLGEFPGPAYESHWMSYDGFADTSGTGDYAPLKVISVHDGALDMNLHTSDGRALGAAPIPLINGQWGGQLYGRYVVRFKADSLPGYGAGWLLWPDSNDWGDGEIDFPEGGLDGTIYANQHCLGDPQAKCLAADTGVEFSSGWHTTMIQWLPSGVTYYLDGVQVAFSPESPSTRMHLVLQTATNGFVPAGSVHGHVLIDSVTISAWG